MYKLKDFKTGQEVKTEDFVFAGEKNPWEVEMDMSLVKQKINVDYFTSAEPCLSKYLPLMPIRNPSNFVSLRETATPLVRSKTIAKELDIDLYFKVEGKNPTGSFKDRGSAIDVSVAREIGAKGLILASTGNMAASCSCYAAAAKMPCYIIVPEGVSMSKLAQVISFGGKIIQVKGSYNDAATLAYKIAKSKNFYLAGDYAFRVEGQKTAAFEIVDQMLFQEVDEVIIPVGCGTNITAYLKGFSDYKELGFIKKIPRLAGVQAHGANALVRAFNENSKHVNSLKRADTIASAIAVPYPIDGDKALKAIYTSGGLALDVTDTEMLQAQYLLSTKEGLFVEIACAATIAYLLKLKSQNRLKKNQKYVCILGGDGLKDPNVVLKAAIQPPIIYPNEKEFNKLYSSNFLENEPMLFVERDTIIFEEEPSLDIVSKKLIKLFGAHYDKFFAEKVQKRISDFLKKGKKISISDLQDIVEASREMTDLKKLNGKLRVVDFQVTTGKDKVSKAAVTVEKNSTLHYAENQGVGPVDAVLKSLCKACPEISYKLTDYKVQKIRWKGADAAVHVELKMVRSGINSVGKGVSPDIIQASVEAFTDAYNI